MLVGEAPGANEDITGQPFVGRAGQYLNTVLDGIGLDRSDVFISNTTKCRPPGNATPKPDTVELCSSIWLDLELELLKPKVVVAMGAPAIKHFLGTSHTVDEVHGMMFYPEETGHPFLVLATYHPAAPLYMPSLLGEVESDFRVLQDWLDGKPVRVMDRYPEAEYVWIDDIEHDHAQGSGVPQQLVDYYDKIGALADTVAVDVELHPDKSMYCYSISWGPGTGYALPPTPANLDLLRMICWDTAILKVFHNLIGVDWQTLHRYRVELVNYTDTMVGAYELGWKPQGLKGLAYRRLGMSMIDYADMVRPARRTTALAYLSEVVEGEWPDPPKIVEKKWKKGHRKEVVVVDFGEFTDGADDGQITMMVDVPDQLVEHVKQPQNIKKKAKYRINQAAKNPAYDPWVQWYALDESERRVVEDTLGLMPDVGLGEVAEESAESSTAVVAYSARDADATLRLWGQQQTYLHRAPKLDAVRRLDVATLPMALAIMDNGIRIDPGYMRGLALEWGEQLRTLLLDMTDAVGRQFNPASPLQVAEVVYNVLRLPQITKKRTTDAGTLAELSKRTSHPVLAQIIEYRHLNKLKGTYAEVLPDLADDEDRIRTLVKVTRTATGRWASGDPFNGQNIPVRDAEGVKIRRGVVAAPGWVLVGVDQSQVELRTVAHLSNDRTMVQAFHDGLDIHTLTASMVYGVPLEQVTAAMRRNAKTMNFGVVYGISALGFSAVAGTSVRESERFIADYFRRFRGVEGWINRTKAFVANHGYVETLIGRRRYMPEVRHPDWWIVEAALREAVNMPVQGTAAEFMKIAEAVWLHYMRVWGLLPYAKPILQVHDELIIEARKDVWKDVADGTKWLMEHVEMLAEEVIGYPLELRVPIVAETKMGETWGELEKV